VNTDLSNPASNSVTYVTGSWNVPSVSGNSTGYCAVWVGIDGMGSQTVEQIGTGSDVENGVVHYYAWYEMYPDYMIPISTLTISAGDAITASVRYLTSGSYSGMFLLTISDDTTGQSFSIYQTLATAERLSAEWIVEVPSSDAGLLTLADFSPVTFTNAQATVNGVTGAIDSSSWENAQIDLVSYYGSSVLASTSALTDLASGSSFTVTRTSVAASTLATSTSLLSQGVGSLVALAAAPMDSTATPAWLAGDQGDGVSSSVSSDGETESAGDASAAVDASGLVLPNAAGTTNAANSRNGAKPQRLVAGAGTTTPWALLSSDLGETVKSLWLVDYGCLSAGFLADADAVDRVFSA
jgi:hypothetical protein